MSFRALYSEEQSSHKKTLRDSTIMRSRHYIQKVEWRFIEDRSRRGDGIIV